MQQTNPAPVLHPPNTGAIDATERHAPEQPPVRPGGATAIPDIEIGQVYDSAFRDASVHYASFGSMAEFFGRDTGPHRHDRFYQLHFVQTGHLNLRLDDIAHEADGPLFFLTPPSVPHAFRTNLAAAGHVITIAQQLVWRLFDDDPSLPRHLMTEPRCIALTGSEGHHQARGLTRLFGLLRWEVDASRQGQRASIDALTRLILVTAFRLMHALTETGVGRHHDLTVLRRFHELVDQHFTAHWTLTRYADVLHMTEARLNDLCNRLTDRSPKRIVQERLALEARRYLTFSRLSVDNIAEALGYADTAYFCRVFKRHHGVTPSAYRNQNPGKVQSVPAKVPSAPHLHGAISASIELEDAP